MGDLDNAFDALSLLIKELPEEPDLWHDRALVHFHADRKHEALGDMNEAQRLQPEYSYRYSSRAFIKDSLGDVKGAIEDYEVAIKLDPEDSVAHNNLGLLQEKLGFDDKAQLFYDLADKMAKDQGLSPEEVEDEKPKPRNIQKEIEEEEEAKPSYWQTLRHVFGTRKGWSEFVTFVRNGFKIPRSE